MIWLRWQYSAELVCLYLKFAILEKKSLCLRLFDCSFSFLLVFLGSEPSIIWLS